MIISRYRRSAAYSWQRSRYDTPRRIAFLCTGPTGADNGRIQAGSRLPRRRGYHWSKRPFPYPAVLPEVVSRCRPPGGPPDDDRFRLATARAHRARVRFHDYHFSPDRGVASGATAVCTACTIGFRRAFLPLAQCWVGEDRHFHRVAAVRSCPSGLRLPPVPNCPYPR